MDDRQSRLEAENERLRDRVEQLEDMLFGAADQPLPMEWRLTGSEARLFRALCARDMATKDYLLLAACNALDSDDAPELKIVDVFVCKIRKKLTPFGIYIITHWGQGYSVTPEMRDRFKTTARRAA